jgi:hypothetical protein
VTQRRQQSAADTPSLPRVDDLERDLGTAAGPDDATDPQRRPSVGVRQLSDERGVTLPVDVGEQPSA